MESLATCNSDHKPIYVDCHPLGVEQQRISKLFWYEANWDVEEDCGQQVEKLWTQGPKPTNAVTRIQRLLYDCGQGLTVWGKRKVTKNKAAIKSLSVKLKTLQENKDHNVIGEERRLQHELNLLLDNEDLKWKQMAKRNWYVHGDRNTKFFHACASQ